LVAKIVGDHGGMIECKSQPHKTTFRMLMPVHSGTLQSDVARSEMAGKAEFADLP
jgi:two-component system nitrogen regulation sensor histidine kinase GlnL